MEVNHHLVLMVSSRKLNNVELISIPILKLSTKINEFIFIKQTNKIIRKKKVTKFGLYKN